MLEVAQDNCCCFSELALQKIQLSVLDLIQIIICSKQKLITILTDYKHNYFFSVSFHNYMFSVLLIVGRLVVLLLKQ